MEIGPKSLDPGHHLRWIRLGLHRFFREPAWFAASSVTIAVPGAIGCFILSSGGDYEMSFGVAFAASLVFFELMGVMILLNTEGSGEWKSYTDSFSFISHPSILVTLAIQFFVVILLVLFFYGDPPSDQSAGSMLSRLMRCTLFLTSVPALANYTKYFNPKLDWIESSEMSRSFKEKNPRAKLWKFFLVALVFTWVEAIFTALSGLEWVPLLYVVLTPLAVCYTREAFEECYYGRPPEPVRETYRGLATEGSV